MLPQRAPTIDWSSLLSVRPPQCGSDLMRCPYPRRRCTSSRSKRFRGSPTARLTLQRSWNSSTSRRPRTTNRVRQRPRRRYFATCSVSTSFARTAPLPRWGATHCPTSRRPFGSNASSAIFPTDGTCAPLPHSMHTCPNVGAGSPPELTPASSYAPSVSASSWRRTCVSLALPAVRTRSSRSPATTSPGSNSPGPERRVLFAEGSPRLDVLLFPPRCGSACRCCSSADTAPDHCSS